MIHVRMRDDNVSHFLALFSTECQRNTARVNRDTFVDQKTSQTLLRGCVAVAVKGAG